MQKTDVQHNTPEQVDHYLKQTLAIIEGNEIPDDLRVAAFAAVYNSVCSKQVILEQPQMVPDLGNLRARH